MAWIDYKSHMISHSGLTECLETVEMKNQIK